MFYGNVTVINWGGVYIEENCNVMFDGNSAIIFIFINNFATHGGAMYLAWCFTQL